MKFSLVSKLDPSVGYTHILLTINASKKLFFSVKGIELCKMRQANWGHYSRLRKNLNKRREEKFTLTV